LNPQILPQQHNHNYNHKTADGRKKMGLHNCNLPSSLNRRVLSHKRTALCAKSRAARGEKKDAIIGSEFSGIARGAGVSSKRIKKVQRNKHYALKRKKEAIADELLRTKGEVVMEGMFVLCDGGGRERERGRERLTSAKDAATATLSKRQQKLAERAARVAEANAAARAASKADAAAKAEEAAQKANEEAAMELDDM
jgi:hypothetical protein